MSNVENGAAFNSKKFNDKSHKRTNVRLDAHDNFDLMALKPKLVPKSTLNRITYDGVENYNKNHLDSLNSNDNSKKDENQSVATPRVTTQEAFENYQKIRGTFNKRTWTLRKDSVIDGKSFRKINTLPSLPPRVTEEAKNNYDLSKGSLNIKQILKTNNGNQAKNELILKHSKTTPYKNKDSINNIFNVKEKNNVKETLSESVDTLFTNFSSTNTNTNTRNKVASNLIDRESTDPSRNKQTSMDKIFVNYGRNVTQEKFKPRVKNEAIEILNKSQGTWSDNLSSNNNNSKKTDTNKIVVMKGADSSMNKIFNDYGRNVTKLNFNPRVKKEARENYTKNQGSMNIIQ